MASLPNFDQLLALAQNHPQQFEQLRQQLISDTIANANPSHQARLQALQHNLDTRLDRCSNPTQRMLVASQMMHDKVLHLRDLLNQQQSHQDADVVSLLKPQQRTP
ncbi:DUF3135 domain-containing protein [Ferrimonas senticii]|uniref:DUF3135 domain-containing protein n=1 Tax=Ferrimonas senticii TaxID=394566 RepID=UPI00040205C5|nr:DUF3135 domain-containing protein [Ferrimonas senticii]